MVQPTKQVKSYDAGDLLDAHALAKSQLSWIGALVSTVKQNRELGKEWHNAELLEITQYLCEMFANDHDVSCAAYEQEL